MAQDRTLVIAGLNIVTHPHSPQGYVDLLRALFAMKRPVTLRTTQKIMLGELLPLTRGQPTEGMFGRFYRFDQIDPESPWFNVVSHEAATDEEMAAVSIPSHLKPNLVTFDFVFFPQGHRLYFVSKYDKYATSPGSIRKLFATLVEQESIVQRFGKVEITVLPDHHQLRRILSLHRLAKLTIDVIRPNPDDNSDEDEEVFRRLASQGARRVTQILTAEPRETIRPDRDTEVLARVASHNGKVLAIGYRLDGTREDLSTVARPWKEAIGYDPNIQTGPNALIEFAARANHGRR